MSFESPVSVNTKMSAEHESTTEHRSTNLLRTLRTLDKRREIGFVTGHANSYCKELIAVTEALVILSAEAKVADVPLLALE